MVTKLHGSKVAARGGVAGVEVRDTKVDWLV
jgi:hypothetical protein